MTLGPNRWHVIAESNFPWEREALDWLRTQLPDHGPWHVWTNFEFIDDAGRVNEIDALVLSPAGLFLVEIKSRPGVVTGDAHTWTWLTDGREYSVDNPLLLTDRKAKRLSSLLKRQRAVARAKIRLPFIEPIIFLSSTSLNCKLQDQARAGTFLRGRPDDPQDDGLVAALSRGLRTSHQPPVDSSQVKAIANALSEAGIRPSNRHRQVGDYRLGKLLVDSDTYQEWEAKHVSVDVVRRIRIYNLASATSPEARKARMNQARREFEILEGIDHTGILRCRDYKDTELGPALIFDHDPGALRLDHLIRDHGKRLSISQRLDLVRRIAEVLKFAHSRRLYHRALGPQSVLVRGIGGGDLQVQLMNWQTGARRAGTTDMADAADALHLTTGTLHVEAYVEDPERVYLAPETPRADPTQGPALDVFSLGCLTWLVFSGQPPAPSTLELTARLREGQGLRLSSVLDGCAARLDELVQFATSPEVVARYDTIQDFLSDLDRVEDELTTPDPEQTADPSRAGPGERLEGGFTVVKRLGRGSTSDALLVKRGDSDDERVLKVAVDAAHSDHLQAEAGALRKLHHGNVVALVDTCTVAGRTALLLKNAGSETLAHKLKREGRLSLDMLQRFGEELLDAVRYLEDQAVIHRDIKPDNIGIGEAPSKRLRLVLFDFSLTRTAATNLTAGTAPYLDPFLSLRSHPRWDLAAERFAAAMTLYEMAVGKLPRWGDGQTAPAMLDVEATIDADVFHPTVRPALTAFFEKALRRDFRERHDNAEEMLRAWRAVFEKTASLHPLPADDLETVIQTLTAHSTMVELGYSVEAQDVLDRMGVHDLRGLLAVDRIRFRYLRGVGDRIRREIRLKAKELATRRPDLAQGGETLHTTDDDNESGRTPVAVNELADRLLPRRPAGQPADPDRPSDEAALSRYLGLDERLPAGRWPSLGETAMATGVDRAALTAALLRARERWLKDKAFTELRHQLDALLRAQGQVMTTDEMAQALLALRGCALQGDSERLRLASAVVRAGVEAEAQLSPPRFESYEHEPVSLVATSAAWAAYARQLGDVADICAQAQPLMPPSRALERLEAVRPPQSLETGSDVDPAQAPRPLPPARLLRLATMASRQAALSSRQEIYARGMPASQAIQQSMGALLGAPELKAADLINRVLGRYPQATRPPERPALDQLLQAASAPLDWDPQAAGGDGAYRRRNLETDATAGTTTFLTHQGSVARTKTRSAAAETSAADSDAKAIDTRLQLSLKRGGLLALTVEPRFASQAEARLLQAYGSDAAQSYDLRRLSIDALLLRALRQQAKRLNVDWDTVLRADAASPSSRDWRNLLNLVSRAVPALRKTLLESPVPLLVVHPGLLARYQQMALVSELEANAGRAGQTPSVWLLLPGHQPGVATLEGQHVPLVHTANVLPLARAWLESPPAGASSADARAASPLISTPQS